MRIVTVVSGLALWLAAGGSAAAQTPTVNVDVTGRMQFQWNSTSVTDAEAGEPLASSTFETRRVRLGVDIEVGDWIRGYIEPEYALARLSLKQVWMALEVDPALVIRAGQFKKPFSLINLTSSTAHPMIERGVRIRGLAESYALANAGEFGVLDEDLLIGEHFALLDLQGYAAYDMGVALEGAAGGFGWSAGLFNGAGPDSRDENDAKSLAARVTYALPLDMPVRLGAAWSRRELGIGADDAPETRTGDAFEVDVELGGLRRGWWLLGEVATGRNLVTESRFMGAQGALAYFHATGRARIEGIEPMARVSWGDPDDEIDDDSGVLVTPGVNLYFMGRNRLMFNWDVYMPSSDRFSTQHAGRAQFNLHF
jgi:hypothetical protein